MLVEVEVACPYCEGHRAHVEQTDGPANMRFVVYCDNCVDGAPDAGPQLQCYGRTEAEALAAWNEEAAEWDDLTRAG